MKSLCKRADGLKITALSFAIDSIKRSEHSQAQKSLEASLLRSDPQVAKCCLSVECRLTNNTFT